MFYSTGLSQMGKGAKQIRGREQTWLGDEVLGAKFGDP